MSDSDDSREGSEDDQRNKDKSRSSSDDSSTKKKKPKKTTKKKKEESTKKKKEEKRRRKRSESEEEEEEEEEEKEEEEEEEESEEEERSPKRPKEEEESEEEEAKVPEESMECLVEAHWLPLDKSQIPIAIFCSYLENLFKYPEKRFPPSKNKESPFKKKLKKAPEFEKMGNKYLLNFLKELTKIKSSKESINTLYKSVIDDKDRTRSTIIESLTKGLSCKKDEVTKIPESLDKLANYFKCNIKSDKHEAKCEKAIYDIIIKTRDKEIAIIHKKKFNLSNNYHKAKFLYKQKILKYLLNEKKLQATIFTCLVNEEPIDPKIISTHEQNINHINDYNTKLAGLRIKYSESEESSLLDFFYKTYTALSSEFSQLNKEELANAIKILDSTANIGICARCYNEEELKRFNCGHNFCNGCIEEECSKSKILMKCYFRTCYHILTPEEVEGRYNYPSEVNKESCMLCSPKRKKDHLMHCKSKHYMCKGCLEGYIRYQMKGRIMTIDDETNKPVFAEINCPFHKCDSHFDSKQVETLFSGTEKYIVGNYEEAINT